MPVETDAADHGVAAGREHHALETTLLIIGAYGGSADLEQRRLAQIHQFDMRQVEGLVVMRVETETLGAEIDAAVGPVGGVI